VAHKVYFRPEAQADLFALYNYISQESGAERAGSYISRVEEVCMGLAAFPRRGTPRNDIVPGLRTIGFERRVTIAFRVLAEVVEIVTIAYAGRDFESSLRDQESPGEIDEGAADVKAGKVGDLEAGTNKRRPVRRKPRSVGRRQR
jgi:toxin ParE1/3/4